MVLLNILVKFHILNIYASKLLLKTSTIILKSLFSFSKLLVGSQVVYNIKLLTVKYNLKQSGFFINRLKGVWPTYIDCILIFNQEINLESIQLI